MDNKKSNSEVLFSEHKAKVMVEQEISRFVIRRDGKNDVTLKAGNKNEAEIEALEFLKTEGKKKPSTTVEEPEVTTIEVGTKVTFNADDKDRTGKVTALSADGLTATVRVGGGAAAKDHEVPVADCSIAE